MANERAIAADESTATLERHDFITFSGTGNRDVESPGVVTGGGEVASSVRIGRNIVPMTPLWSKKEVERVMVFPILSRRCRGSQMVR
jgi:hypothetical protein